MLNDPESTPITLESLVSALKAFSSNPSNNGRPVYIEAVTGLDIVRFIEVVNEIRKTGIRNISLVAASRGSTPDGKKADKPPEPDRVFGVMLPQEKDLDLNAGEKPNPLLLAVRLGEAPGEAAELNSESSDSLDSLAMKLSEIFRMREQNGVFRAGTNEIEKTVWVRADSRPEKYGDLMMPIDAVKSGGSSPIILTNQETFDRLPKGAS